MPTLPTPAAALSVLRGIGMTVGWFALCLVGFEVQCLIGQVLTFVVRLMASASD